MANFGFLKRNGAWQDQFIRAVVPAQVLIATRTANIANATTVNVVDSAKTDASGNFSTNGFSRITGHARSDAALTLKVYQGDNTTTLDYSTSVAIPASAVAGAGGAFSVEVIGQYARVTINNASGADTTALNAAVYLRSM